ncbi:RNA-directed DNA polymerase, eukaryota [Tanacetum coccineum]
MSGKYGTSNAGAEYVGVSDCNKVYKEAGNEAVMSISVDDCIDLDGMERSILAKVKDLSVLSKRLKQYFSEGFDDVGLRYVGGRWVWLEFDSMDQVESVKTSKALKEIFLEFKMFLTMCLDRPGGSAIGIIGSRVYKSWVGFGVEAACLLDSIISNRLNRIIATDLHIGSPILNRGGQFRVYPLERKMQRVLILDEIWKMRESIWMSIVVISDPLMNVNNDYRCRLLSGFAREDVRGVKKEKESDLVDSFEEGEIRDDSVLYNDGCIKDCMERLRKMIFIAPEKDSIIAPPSTPPGNDLNIAVESGSSWIDYIGPLTSDEIDSDKRWSYRDPNGNIHGLFSLAQLRSWKDYFPSDLQIWSYYGNVKEAILLHNALSRQTKDAG